ncbi:LPXTG cell wall anchor domain-containing protein [Enterococcus sp. AD013-P3]|uniref:LPXTG cell wall anchor domain-containing protein n=1 Tax=Enterococcus sp. AD013-P3 TaxID=3411036 RepID=UPI003B94E780
MKIASIISTVALACLPIAGLATNAGSAPQKSGVAVSQNLEEASSYANVNKIEFGGDFSSFNSGEMKLEVGKAYTIPVTVSFSGDSAAILQAQVLFENVDPRLKIEYDDNLVISGSQGSFSFSVTLLEGSDKPAQFTVKVTDSQPDDANHLTPYSQRQTVYPGDTTDTTDSTDTTSTTDSTDTTDTTSTTDSTDTTDTTSTTDTTDSTDTTSTTDTTDTTSTTDSTDSTDTTDTTDTPDTVPTTDSDSSSSETVSSTTVDSSESSLESTSSTATEKTADSSSTTRDNSNQKKLIPTENSSQTPPTNSSSSGHLPKTGEKVTNSTWVGVGLVLLAAAGLLWRFAGNQQNPRRK